MRTFPGPFAEICFCLPTIAPAFHKAVTGKGSPAETDAAQDAARLVARVVAHDAAHSVDHDAASDAPS